MLRAQDAGNAVMTDKQLRDELQVCVAFVCAVCLLVAVGDM